MGTVVASGKPREAKIKLVVLNADGTVKQDLGVVSYYHRNPLKRLAFHIGKLAKRLGAALGRLLKRE